MNARADPIVCACTDMTQGRFVELMRELNPTDFDTFLEQTGASMQCTACRLDLEMLFMEPPEVPTSSKTTEIRANYSRQVSIKRKLLQTLDRISPLICRPLSDYSPILKTSKIKTYILVANDTPLFARNAETKSLQVTLDVRDSDGRCQHKERFDVAPGEQLVRCVSDALTGAVDGQVQMGSVQVDRKWSAMTFRGTTRPQLLLHGQGGCGAVHTQGPNRPGTIWFSILEPTDGEKHLVSVVNAENQPVHATLTIINQNTIVPPSSVTLAARGTHLFEVPTHASRAEAGKIVTLRLEVTGMHKAHIYSSDDGLTRASIDHPSES